MRQLVESIAKALVDHPDDVKVNAVDGEQVTVLELRVHPEDLSQLESVLERAARTDGEIDPNAAGCRRDEIEKTVHTRNSGISGHAAFTTGTQVRERYRRAHPAASRTPR